MVNGTSFKYFSLLFCWSLFLSFKEEEEEDDVDESEDMVHAESGEHATAVYSDVRVAVVFHRYMVCVVFKVKIFGGKLAS